MLFPQREEGGKGKARRGNCHAVEESTRADRANKSPGYRSNGLGNPFISVSAQ